MSEVINSKPAPIDVQTTGRLNREAIAAEVGNGGKIDYSNPEIQELVGRIFPN